MDDDAKAALLAVKELATMMNALVSLLVAKGVINDAEYGVAILNSEQEISGKR